MIPILLRSDRIFKFGQEETGRRTANGVGKTNIGRVQRRRDPRRESVDESEKRKREGGARMEKIYSSARGLVLFREARQGLSGKPWNRIVSGRGWVPEVGSQRMVDGGCSRESKSMSVLSVCARCLCHFHLVT